MLFIAPLFWSVNYLVRRLAPVTFAPHILALLRWTLAALVLLPFASAELLARRSSAFKNSWHYLVFSALGTWICGAWVCTGARSIGATNIALIYALSPVFIALISSLWLGERLSRLRWLGITLAFARLLHVVCKGQWSALAQVKLTASDLWILGATARWTLYSIFFKRGTTEFGSPTWLVLHKAGGALVLRPLTAIEAMSGLLMTQIL